MPSVLIGIVIFGVGGCQDVQLDSTRNAGIEQTGLDGASDRLQEAVTVRKVDLEILGQPRPAVNIQGRDPFQLEGVSDGVDRAGVTQDDTGEPPPAAAQSFGESREIDAGQLAMIGVVRTDDTRERIAVLTDGNVVLHGRKGEIIDGRYRIVDVMSAAVMIEFIHDGAQQLIELSDF